MIYGTTASVRRLHDTKKSGAYILVGFIPIIGPIILLIAYCTTGDQDDNMYGPVPETN